MSVLQLERPAVSRSARPAQADPVHGVILPAIIGVLAVLAGALHLLHNYLPMSAPTGAGGPPPSGAAPAMDPLMSVLMPLAIQSLAPAIDSGLSAGPDTGRGGTGLN
jgi:hypothetical protein